MIDVIGNIIDVICAAAGVLILLYFIALMPSFPSRTDKRALFTSGGLFAHRGLYGGDIKENTLPAFTAAVEHGYGVELDVQLSSDGVPVVAHDFTLKRVFGKDERVDSITADRLEELGVPRLDKVLAALGGKVPLIAEYKTESRDMSVCEKAAPLLDSYSGGCCVESFNPFVLVWYKKHYPQTTRGQLSGDLIKEGKKGFLYFLLGNLLFNFIAKPDFIAYDIRYAGSFSLYICRQLYHCMTAGWTVRGQDELDACAAKFDLFIFENFEPSRKDEKNDV